VVANLFGWLLIYLFNYVIDNLVIWLIVNLFGWFLLDLFT